jgi:polar amino acid transport system substrate-binding protein
MKTKLLAAALVVGLVASLSAQTKTLVFVTQDKQDFPWVMGDSSEFQAAKPGASVDLVQAIAAKLGIGIEVRRYPWARCLETELKTGSADGAFLASYKPEREIFGLYPQKDGKTDASRRVNTSTYSFYRLKSSTWNWDGKTVGKPGGAVGIPAGYSIGDDLKAMGFEVLTSANTESNFRNLINGRLALVATLELDGDYLLEHQAAFKGKIEKVATPIVSKPYYIMLSRQFVERDPALAERIWAAAAELREKSLKAFLAKYF